MTGFMVDTLAAICIAGVVAYFVDDKVFGGKILKGIQKRIDAWAGPGSNA